MTYLKARQVHLRNMEKDFHIYSFGAWRKTFDSLHLCGSPRLFQGGREVKTFCVILRNYLPFLLTFFHQCTVSRNNVTSSQQTECRNRCKNPPTFCYIRHQIPQIINANFLTHYCFGKHFFVISKYTYIFISCGFCNKLP